MTLGKYGRNPGWGVLALVCFVYGVGVPIAGAIASESFTRSWTLYGSFVCGALFLALMVVPFLIWAFGRRSGLAVGADKVG